MSKAFQILKQNNVLVFLSMFFVVFLFHYPALQNGFTYDDIIFVVDNLKIRSIPNIFNLLFQSTEPLTSYRPLTLLSYAFEYSFFGLEPFYYHLNNLLIHVVVCFLIFLVFYFHL